MARTAMGAAAEYARSWVARRHGHEPERVTEVDQGERRLRVKGGYTPLALDAPLPPDHALYDSASDLRRKRLALERQRRGL